MKEAKKHHYNGMEFDSYEEIEFFQWLEEAKSHGLISTFQFHPQPFELAPAAAVYVRKPLATKTKVVKRHLLQDCCYTADFMFEATPDLQRINHQLFSPDHREYWIDVKGVFSMYNDSAKFSLIQKWMWSTHGVFINKVVPVKFFENTFVPRHAVRTKTGKLRACYVHCRKIHEVPAERNFPNLEIVPRPAVPADLFQPKEGWNF